MTTEPTSPNPQTPTLPAMRHDGWTGDKMAIFLETLADTAVVAEACEKARMGLSGAYALRRRNAHFAIAWDAALGLAREKLADTLLARAMEGNIEQIWRNGAIVGERHVLDNRLGLAILRRLDRLAETGGTVSTRGERPTGKLLPLAPPPIDWDQALDALRSGDPDAIAHALATVQGNEVDEVDEVEDPSISLSQGDDEPREIDLSDRIWRDENEDMWLTDFPPPPGFDGYQQQAWNEDGYERECTPEEVSAILASNAAEAAAERADDEADRDAWFELLRADALRHPGLDPGSACPS